MPRMNSCDAARAIRTMDRSCCKQIPIVAMTANAFAEDVQAAVIVRCTKICADFCNV